MWISNFIRERRWFFLSLSGALLIPAVALSMLSLYAEDVSEEEALAAAAVAVKNYVDAHPPKPGWRTTKIYVGDEQNVVMDVHVPDFDHASVIGTRSERVKYSYLKLACPPSDAWVHDWLEGNDRIWVHLHHHGKTLLRAPCPSGGNSFFS